jgi:undecaprenyl-diphosphatase
VTAWAAVLLGAVEGLTEFLPVSSTGHLILTAKLLQIEGKRQEVFVIVIQLGAILSVVWEYRSRLGRAVLEWPRGRWARGFLGGLGVAFLPFAVLGVLLHDLILRHLFSVRSVAAALVAGGVLILLVESLPLRVRVQSAEQVSWGRALGIGLAQCLALWPGFSRSAATILGGLAVGLDRRAATEFSFFLAIPVMFAATSYDLVRNWRHLDPQDLAWLAVAFVISFVVAWGSVRWLLRFVSTHRFTPFAWYRLTLGAALLVLGPELAG